MKKRIDSTLYFLQYIICRVMIIQGIGVLIYSIVTKEGGAIVASLIFTSVAIYASIKKLPKPDDLKFDENFLYLDKVPYPIEIEKIKSIENDIILYKVDGDIINITMPRYSFIDKSYKELKRIVENQTTASTRKKD